MTEFEILTFSFNHIIDDDYLKKITEIYQDDNEDPKEARAEAINEILTRVVEKNIEFEWKEVEKKNE